MLSPSCDKGVLIVFAAVVQILSIRLFALGRWQTDTACARRIAARSCTTTVSGRRTQAPRTKRDAHATSVRYRPKGDIVPDKFKCWTGCQL